MWQIASHDRQQSKRNSKAHHIGNEEWEINADKCKFLLEYILRFSQVR